ncbi:hypothetical protein [Streptomyces fulvorobeus]|uniref:Lipoprotein n=1 Tax=Streptomyces fulvorobeus TaxID=284028 RepID=A0A7Y9HHU7_9ACTN|nr:hypothetical protein [Streptomyces fulvorobeus]NYE44813.1 hypothetical protein [Streptomyces fulvorobeus]
MMRFKRLLVAAVLGAASIVPLSAATASAAPGDSCTLEVTTEDPITGETISVVAVPGTEVNRFGTRTCEAVLPGTGLFGVRCGSIVAVATNIGIEAKCN